MEKENFIGSPCLRGSGVVYEKCCIEAELWKGFDAPKFSVKMDVATAIEAIAKKPASRCPKCDKPMYRIPIKAMPPDMVEWVKGVSATEVEDLDSINYCNGCRVVIIDDSNVR